MKKLLFAILLTTGLVLGASAQQDKAAQQDKTSAQQDRIKESDVPTAVQTSFKTEFPNAKDVEWKMKEGKYKVKFELNDIDHMAAYGTDGKLMSKGMKINQSELPSAVASAVKSTYADRSIDDVYKVDKNGTVQYLVKLNGTPETRIMYSADGQVINDKKHK